MPWTLVTGGSKRLGAEICRTLAADGYSLIIHYRTDMQEAIKVADSCRNHGVRAEILQGEFSSNESTKQFIQTCLAEYGPIKNLINNVGIYPKESVLNTSPDHLEALFQVNLHTPFALIQGFLPGIRESRGGIINLGVAGIEMARAAKFNGAYRLTKTTLLALTRSLAYELASDLVRVNMVSPGQLDISVDQPDPHTLPMGRLVMSKEVARTIAFLLQDDNVPITGQNIEIAGGLSL